MPYRRLPNTDQSRLYALRTAIEQHEQYHFVNDLVISYRLIQEAKTFLNRFEKSINQYRQAHDNQVEQNKKNINAVKNVRLYISHFIQVLNLCVLRDEIKREHKLFYKLEPDNFSVPDLSTEANLLEWGKNLIEGEEKRLQNGGIQIYNPTIAKVKVHYDIFENYKIEQSIYQKTTRRFMEAVAEMRQAGDNIIQAIWDEVEAKFASLLPYERLTKCRQYGLIYYYRRGEEELTPEKDNILKEAEEKQKLINSNRLNLFDQ